MIIIRCETLNLIRQAFKHLCRTVLIFWEVACENIMHRKNYIFQIKCNQFTLIIKNPTKPLMFVRKIQKNVDNSALVRNYWSNNNGHIKTIS